MEGRTASIARIDLKRRIQRHYDIAAPLYRRLWGIHIHHGYWKDGSETKELAQEQLSAVLAAKAKIQNGSRILDVGCGFGGSAKYLAEHFGARVTGISISEEQIRTAYSIVKGCQPAPVFAVMDAEDLGIAAEFDVIWSIEAISHLTFKKDCFRNLLAMLVPNGRVAIVDWFKADGLDHRDEQRYIEPIIRQMLLPELSAMGEYTRALEVLGCRTVETEDISDHVSKTWDVCLNLRKLPVVWKFAVAHGSDFVSFVRGFSAMKQGFRSGAFQCRIIIAEKVCD